MIIILSVSCRHSLCSVVLSLDVIAVAVSVAAATFAVGNVNQLHRKTVECTTTYR